MWCVIFTCPSPFVFCCGGHICVCMGSDMWYQLELANRWHTVICINFVCKMFVLEIFRVPIIIFVHINVPYITFAILYSSTSKKKIINFRVCVRRNFFNREIFANYGMYCLSLCNYVYVYMYNMCTQANGSVHVYTCAHMCSV